MATVTGLHGVVIRIIHLRNLWAIHAHCTGRGPHCPRVRRGVRRSQMQCHAPHVMSVPGYRVSILHPQVRVQARCKSGRRARSWRESLNEKARCQIDQVEPPAIYISTCHCTHSLPDRLRFEFTCWCSEFLKS